MNRRRFLLAATALLVTGKTFSAPDIDLTHKPSGGFVTKLGQPYHAIGHFKSDAERVYMFISFDCPYCANTWAGYAQWDAPCLSHSGSSWFALSAPKSTTRPQQHFMWSGSLRPGDSTNLSARLCHAQHKNKYQRDRLYPAVAADGLYQTAN